MKLLFLFLFLCFSSAAFSQIQMEEISFDAETTSDSIDAPTGTYLGGIAKPDSGGDIITFEGGLASGATTWYTIMTADPDSAYTLTLPDSTNAYAIPLPRDLFIGWPWIRVVFAKSTTCDLTVIWKR